MAFNVGDRVRKVTGWASPYEMTVTGFANKMESLRGIVTVGNAERPVGVEAGDVAHHYELIEAAAAPVVPAPHVWAIGDRFRRTVSAGQMPQHQEGYEDTVTRLDVYQGRDFVRGTVEGIIGHYCDNIELVAAAPAASTPWAIGDRFRRTKPGGDFWVGYEGVVQGVTARGVRAMGSVHGFNCIERVGARAPSSSFGAAVASVANKTINNRGSLQLSSTYGHNSCAIHIYDFMGGTAAQTLTEEDMVAAVGRWSNPYKGKQARVVVDPGHAKVIEVLLAANFVEIGRTDNIVMFMNVSNNGLKKSEPSGPRPAPGPRPTVYHGGYFTFRDGMRRTHKTIYLSHTTKAGNIGRVVEQNFRAFEPKPGELWDVVLAGGQTGVNGWDKLLVELGWRLVYTGQNGGTGNMIHTYILEG